MLVKSMESTIFLSILLALKLYNMHITQQNQMATTRLNILHHLHLLYCLLLEFYLFPR